MRQKQKTIVFFIFAFILLPFAGSVTSQNEIFVLAQDGGSFMQNILGEGAELLVANINPDGEAEVIYGQLGLPTIQLSYISSSIDNAISGVVPSNPTPDIISGVVGIDSMVKLFK